MEKKKKTVEFEAFGKPPDVLSGIDLNNLVQYPKNLIGSGKFGEIYYVQDAFGKKSKAYAVKFIRLPILIPHTLSFTEMFRNLFSSTADVEAARLEALRKEAERQKEYEAAMEAMDKSFKEEVKTLVALKGKGIGPEIVYANYAKHYFVMEKMDTTLDSLLTKNELKIELAREFLGLIEKYLGCDYYHKDLHLQNIMWSEKLEGFRIIDWGEFVEPCTKSESKNRKKKYDLFSPPNGTFWVCIVYIKGCMTTEEDEQRKNEWIAISKKYSTFITTNLVPKYAEQYDIFSWDKADKRWDYVKPLLTIFEYNRKLNQKAQKTHAVGFRKTRKYTRNKKKSKKKLPKKNKRSHLHSTRRNMKNKKN